MSNIFSWAEGGDIVKIVQSKSKYEAHIKLEIILLTTNSLKGLSQE